MPDKLMKRLHETNTKDCLWIYILRIIYDKPTHAYRLRKEIELRFGFKPGTVTAYRVIYHLTSHGFVSKAVDGRRKVYSITEKGKKELRKAIEFYSSQIKNLKF